MTTYFSIFSSYKVSTPFIVNETDLDFQFPNDAASLGIFFVIFSFKKKWNFLTVTGQIVLNQKNNMRVLNQWHLPSCVDIRDKDKYV